jgi:hypothetical protein
MSSGMQCLVVLFKFTGVSEEGTASIFRVEGQFKRDSSKKQYQQWAYLTYVNVFFEVHFLNLGWGSAKLRYSVIFLSPARQTPGW